MYMNHLLELDLMSSICALMMKPMNILYISIKEKVVQVSNGQIIPKDPNNPYRAKSAYIQKIQAAVIKWDPEQGEAHGCETVQYLLKKLWNKQVEGAWGLDVNLSIGY